MEHKNFRGRIELKADSDQTGEIKMVFSTLGVVDLDKDLTLPGAFEKGAPARISQWGHSSWEGPYLPVGKGVLGADDKEAWMEGKFFLDTIAGKEHYLTVKALGDLQEWSYAYDVLEEGEDEVDGEKVRVLKKLKVHEVSPVLLGAGIGTRTDSIKGHKRGARHSQKDNEAIQAIHDRAVELGAKCRGAEDNDNEAAEGEDTDEAQKSKPQDPKPSTLASRVALELMEI